MTLHNRYLSYKTDHLFYQTRHLSLPNRAKQSINKASVYVYLGLYAVMSQPWVLVKKIILILHYINLDCINCTITESLVSMHKVLVVTDLLYFQKFVLSIFESEVGLQPSCAPPPQSVWSVGSVCSLGSASRQSDLQTHFITNIKVMLCLDFIEWACVASTTWEEQYISPISITLKCHYLALQLATSLGTRPRKSVPNSDCPEKVLGMSWVIWVTF